MDLRLETFLPYRLNRAAAMSSRQFSHIYRHAFGLTVPEWRVLAAPGAPRPTPAHRIGRDSPMSPPKVRRAARPLPPRPSVAGARPHADHRLDNGARAWGWDARCMEV